MSDNIQRMALALADVETELRRRRDEEGLLEPPQDFLDNFDDIDDDEDIFDGDMDSEDD